MIAIEDGLNLGAQGKKLSADNQSALKSMKNKFKKYLQTENLVADIENYKKSGAAVISTQK